MFKRKDADKYDDFAMKCPLLLNSTEAAELLNFMDVILDTGDDWVKERNEQWDNHRVHVTFKEQQKQVKHIRAKLGYDRNNGFLAHYFYAECANVQGRFAKFFKAIEKCRKQKEKGKKYIKWPDRPEPRGDKLRRIPRWFRSINLRETFALKSIHKSMRRLDDSPLQVEFKLPGLADKVAYRNTRNIPANAELTQMTISHGRGKWWVSFSWRSPKGDPENLILTATEAVPDFANKHAQEIIALLDQSREKFKGVDLGCNNYLCLSDDSAPERFNLSEEHEARKEFLRKKGKHYQTKQKRKNKANGDQAYEGENYKKNVIKQQNVSQHMTNIDQNQRYQMIAVLEKECHILVLEDLNNKEMQESGRISRDTKRRMAETGFGEIKRLAIFKFGDRLILVDPRDTSRTCSLCGFCDKRNRNGDDFKCRQCGYTAQADKNASYNILAAGVVAEPEKFRFKVVQ